MKSTTDLNPAVPLSFQGNTIAGILSVYADGGLTLEEALEMINEAVND